MWQQREVSTTVNERISYTMSVPSINNSICQSICNNTQCLSCLMRARDFRVTETIFTHPFWLSFSGTSNYLQIYGMYTTNTLFLNTAALLSITADEPRHLKQNIKEQRKYTRYLCEACLNVQARLVRFNAFCGGMRNDAFAHQIE